MNMSRERLAWIAGFFDGEGCLHVSKIKRTKRTVYQYELSVTIANSHFESLSFIRDTFGSGSIGRRWPKKGTMYSYYWRIGGAPDVIAFLRAIRPYAKTKAKEIDCVLSRWPKERDKICQELKRLKRTQEIREPELKEPAKGESHSGAKLNEEAVKVIRWYRDNDLATCEKLAELHKVSPALISKVALRKCWGHLK